MNAGAGPSRLRYLDFDLMIETDGESYEARVIDSPVGETGPVSFRPPVTDLELENFLLKLGHVRGGRVRSIESARTASIKDFGSRLFDAVFHDDVLLCLRRSLDRADSKDLGLRLRLRLGEAPELAELPWEFLYDRRTNRFFCLSGRTPVVRYLELAEAVQREPLNGPLNMLVLISSPTDYPALDVDQEWAKLSAAVAGLVSSGRLTVTRLAEPTLDALQRELRRGEYHIFHYVGHGGVDPSSRDGVLVFADRTGRGRLESGQDLGALLLDERSLRLAVLNSCEGARTEGGDLFAGTAQALVQQGVPAVVAMQFEITDDAAIAFARNLYEALADGYPIDAATSEARKAMLALSKTEWATPVLFMRAADGQLFDHAVPAAVSPATSTPASAVPPQRSVIGTTAAPAAVMTAPPRPPSAPPAQQPVPPPVPHPVPPPKRRTGALLATGGVAALILVGLGVALTVALGTGTGPSSNNAGLVSTPSVPDARTLEPTPQSSTPAVAGPVGAVGAVGASTGNWATAANAACSRHVADVAAATNTWALAFATASSSGDVASLATATDDLADAGTEQVNDLARVAAPPQIRARVNQGLALERRSLDTIDDSVRRLRSGDLDGYGQQFQEGLQIGTQANAIWDELGATSCTGD